METSSRELNIKYAFVQAGYWMGFCVAFSFGAVMLQARGCSNAELGGIIAAGNICGFILSPMLAERLDSSKRLTVYHALWALQLFELVLLAAFALIPGHGTAVAVIYTLYIAIEVCINPVNTQLYNLMELRGIHINYGHAQVIRRGDSHHRTERLHDRGLHDRVISADAVGDLQALGGLDYDLVPGLDIQLAWIEEIVFSAVFELYTYNINQLFFLCSMPSAAIPLPAIQKYALRPY